ncbi:hypothetical protein INT45_014245 [Circinella minor]|uniref:Uncharacterized protein n=1 Tax=Circinella minor TaxID=1195481 RepID=A0A8H7SDV8_9FUNG|nr:hypothetical protein INT45_014245 [Circinella minor]
MFGNDHNHQATNNTWVLNTRKWEWVTYIDGIEPTPPVKGPAYPPQNDNGNGSPLEKPGTIIGAVVGSVAGLVCISLGLVWIKQRRRRNAAQQDDEAIKTTEVENASSPLQRNSSNNGDANITPAPPQYSRHGENDSLTKIDDNKNDNSNSHHGLSRSRNNNNGYHMNCYNM